MKEGITLGFKQAWRSIGTCFDHKVDKDQPIRFFAGTSMVVSEENHNKAQSKLMQYGAYVSSIIEGLI